MKAVVAALFFILFISLAWADNDNATLSWYVDSTDSLALYLDANHHPNLNDNVGLTLSASKNGVPVTSATVSSKAVKIGGSTTDLNFTTTGDGNWTDSFQFSQNTTLIEP